MYCPGCGSAEQRLKFDHVVGEVLGGGVDVPPERADGELVGARRAAEAEIDAAGKQARQRAELLGDDQRRMVGQHDAAGADADGRRAAGDMADDHRGGGAGDARHVVVLGEPVAGEAPALGMAGEIERVGERLGGAAASDDGRQIENGEWDHERTGLRRVDRTNIGRDRARVRRRRLRP